MTTSEIKKLLIDLQCLAHETEQAEQVILRKAQERLSQLSDTPCSETERRLLQDVICRAEATLGLKSQANQAAPKQCTKGLAIGAECSSAVKRIQ